MACARCGARRGFSIVSVLVMALGIGATTSLFTIVRAVLLRPLPFRDPGRLVMLYDHFRHNHGGDGFNTVAAGDYRDWRAQSHGFEDMAAMRGYGGIISGVQSELPEVVQSAAGSANLFPLLGVSPVLGRTLLDAEDQPEGEPVVLLTWSIFQRRFAGDPSIIGKQVHLDTKPTTVIGVLPSWFTYPDARIQFWMPYAQTFSPGDYGMHAGHQSMVVARLKPGVSAEAATREVSALQYRIHLANASEACSGRRLVPADDRRPGQECADASAGAARRGWLHAPDCLPEPRQPSGSAVGCAAQRGCGAWRAGRQPVCSHLRTDDRKLPDLLGRRRGSACCSRSLRPTGSLPTGVICPVPIRCMSMDGFSLLR